MRLFLTLNFHARFVNSLKIILFPNILSHNAETPPRATSFCVDGDLGNEVARQGNKISRRCDANLTENKRLVGWKRLCQLNTKMESCNIIIEHFARDKIRCWCLFNFIYQSCYVNGRVLGLKIRKQFLHRQIYFYWCFHHIMSMHEEISQVNN